MTALRMMWMSSDYNNVRLNSAIGYIDVGRAAGRKTSICAG